MPKQKHLNVRYTVRLSDYLSNEMIKHTLKSGQDYSSFIRMAISTYLKNKNATSDTQNIPMSATKTPFSDVYSVFGEDSPTVDNTESDDAPFSQSLYGWD